jgi:hypothetical protein
MSPSYLPRRVQSKSNSPTTCLNRTPPAEYVIHIVVTRKLFPSSSGCLPKYLHQFAGLYQLNDMNTEAEEIYLRALRGYEKAWGVEHTSMLNTVNNVGVLYSDQGKMEEEEEEEEEEGEEMCVREHCEERRKR